jgi:hypothetical protein
MFCFLFNFFSFLMLLSYSYALSDLRFTTSGYFFLFLNLRLQVTSLVSSKFSFIFLFSCSTKIHRNSTFGIFWILCWTLQWSLNIRICIMSQLIGPHTICILHSILGGWWWFATWEWFPGMVYYEITVWMK